MHRLGCIGFFLSGILLEFRMFFCIIEEESTQDNTYDSTYEKEKLEMSYQPLYTITNQILAYVSSISEKIGNISATHNLESKPHL